MSPFHRYRWLVFGILAAGYVTVIFHRLCPAVVALDLIRDFAATGALMGVMASAYFYPYALMQIPSGILADSFGPRRTVTLSLAFAGIGSLAFGMAPTVEAAVAARVIVGLGASMLFVSTLKIISQWFTKGEFATMSGLMNAAGGVGALTAAAPLAMLTGLVGWRADFWIIGGATLVVVIAIWMIVRDSPRDLGWPPVEAELASSPARESWGVLMANLRAVVTRRPVWFLAGWFFLQGGVFFGIGGLWGGPYLMNVYGMTRQQAGNVLNMISIGMIIGSIAAPWLSNNIFRARRPVLLIFTALFVADLTMFALFPATLPQPLLYFGFLIFAVCGSGSVPVAFAASKELFRLDMAGVVLGFTNMFPLGGGAAFQPVIGALVDRWTRDANGAYPIEAYQAMWVLCLIAGVAMFVCALMVPKEVGKH